jgi:hypothetical protein
LDKENPPLLLVCPLAMHLAIGLAMGMYPFALIMIVLNVAEFGLGTKSWLKQE